MNRQFLLICTLFAATAVQSFGQNADCTLSENICISGEVVINDESGFGAINDFQNPANQSGCIGNSPITGVPEVSPSWFNFTIDNSVAPGSSLEFTITPNGFGVDYDFAIWGPNVGCDNLGSPIRCNFSGATGPTGIAGGGGGTFDAAMTVNPGETYFMMITNYSADNSGATFTWGGNASQVNFDAAANDPEICVDNITSFTTTYNGTVPLTYQWTSNPPNGINFLDDPNSPNPTVTIPLDAQPGVYIFTVEGIVTAACTDGSEEQISLTINALPDIQIPDPGLICTSNDPVFLTANPGGGSGTWGGVAGTGGSIDPSILGPGTYTVTYEYTDANGCTADGMTDITVVESPEAEIVGDFNVCRSEITEQTAVIDGFGLNGTPGYTYSWTTPVGIDNNQTVFIIEPGSYTLTVTDALGCTGEAPEVFVVVDPDPVVMISDPGVICGSSDLHEFFAFTFENGSGEWDTSTGVINDIGFINPAQLGPGIFEVMYTFTSSATGCQTTEFIEFEISSPPTADPSTNGPYCNSADIELFGNSNINSVTYSWTGPNGFTSNEQNPATANGPGTYTLITNIGGCESMPTELEITLGDAPTATANNSGVACAGDMVSLQGDVDITGNTITYAWTGPGGYTSNAQNPTDATLSGDYELIVTVDGCPSAVASTTVTINPTPDAIISNTGTFCADEPIQLMGSTSAAGTNTTYEWSGPNGYNSTEQNPDDIMLDGTYILVVTVDGCTSPQEMTTVTITPLPIAQPTTGGSLCTSADIELLGNSDTPGVTYAWTGPGGFTSDEQNPAMDNGAGIYTLVVSLGSCSSEPVNLDVNPGTAPLADATALDEYCEGDMIELTGAVNATGMVVEYSWSGPNGYTSTDQNPTDVTEAGNYILNVTVDGCVADPDDVEIVINPTPTSIPSTGGPYCDGDDIELFGNANTTTATYSWTGPNGFISSNQNPTTASEGGTYTLTVFENGCPSDAIDVNVVLNETPTAQADNTGPYCSGDPIALTGDVNIAGSTTTYAWTGPGGYVSTEQNPTDATEAGEYSFVATVDGCISNTDITTVMVNELPEAQPATGGSPCTATTIELLGNSNVSGMGETYSWTGPNGFVSDEQNPPTNTGAGSYFLTVTLNGCSSAPAELIVDPGADPVATANNEGPFCEGEMIELSGSVNATGTTVDYAWTGPNGYISTEQNPTDAMEAGEYSFVATVDGCISNTDITTVVINTTPVAELTPNAIILCNTSAEGSTLDFGPLVISGDQGGTWVETTSSGASGTFPNLDFNGVIPGEYVFVYTTNSAIAPCVDPSYTITITIEECACSGVNLNTPAPLCNVDGSLDLSTLVNSGPDGFWTILSTPAGTSPANLNNTILEAANADQGTYTLQYTLIDAVPNGCETEFTIDLEVNSATTAGVANAPLDFCSDEGNSVDLFSELIGADAGGSWTIIQGDATGFDGGNGTFVTNGQPSDTYVFQYELMSNGACPGDTELVTININELPTAEAGAGTTLVCGMNEFMLTANGTTGSDIQISWAGPGMITNGDTYTPTITSPGLFTLMVENTVTGCSNTDIVEIMQDADVPVVNVLMANPLTCDSSSVVLSASTNLITLVDYSWTGPNGFVSTEQYPSVSSGGDYFVTIFNPDNNCTSSPALVTVEDISQTPDIDIVVPLEPLDCDTDALVVDASGSQGGLDLSFTWTNSENELISTAAAFEIMEPGTYQLMITNAFTGCTAMESFMIEQDITEPVPSIVTPGIIDCNNPSVIVTGTSQSSGNNPVYNWYDGSGNLITSDNAELSATSAGVYTLEVINGENQCSATTEVTVTADLETPVVSINTPDRLDCTVTEITLSGEGSATGDNITYEWQNAAGEVIGTELSVEVNTIGNYQLVVTNTDNGCTAQEMEAVENNGADIETAVIITEPSDCFEADNAVIIVSEVIGGTAPFIYSIGDEVPSAQNAYFNLSPGVYEVAVADALGCEFETEVTVTEPDPLNLTIDLNLEADQSLFFGDSLILNAQTFVPDNQIDTLIWNQPDIIRCEDEDCFGGVVNNLFDPTSFTATLIDTAGCTVSATVAVEIEKVREIYIPNSFSPNDDGLNDIFFINGGRGIDQINSFTVYNRWGEVVYSNINFQPNDPDQGWNGTFRGKEVNPAVYVYVAEIKFVDGFEEMYSGDVTVMK